MESDVSGEVFTKNNNKLLDIAAAANVFFWIGIGLLPIVGLTKTLQLKNQFEASLVVQNINASFASNIMTNPAYGFQFLGELLNVLFIGFVIILVLRAISLGLRMIVETDVNYRLSGEKK